MNIMLSNGKGQYFMKRDIDRVETGYITLFNWQTHKAVTIQVYELHFANGKTEVYNPNVVTLNLVNNGG